MWNTPSCVAQICSASEVLNILGWWEASNPLSSPQNLTPHHRLTVVYLNMSFQVPPSLPLTYLLLPSSGSQGAGWMEKYKFKRTKAASAAVSANHNSAHCSMWLAAKLYNSVIISLHSDWGLFSIWFHIQPSYQRQYYQQRDLCLIFFKLIFLMQDLSSTAHCTVI